MSWFYVDDGFPDCPKLAAIPARRLLRVVGLWTMAGAWSRKKLTGGFIPGGQVSRLGGSAEDAQALVNCGLWELSENGYKFHDWSEWQETPEEVEAKRSQERAKKQAWRRKKQGQSPPRPPACPPPCPPGTPRGQPTMSTGESPPCPGIVQGDPSPSPSPSPLALLGGRQAPGGDQIRPLVKAHPSRLLPVLLEELASEAFERNLKPKPTAPDSQLRTAAERVDDLVRGGVFAEPRAAARALVRAALDLVQGHKRPLGLALLDATVAPPQPEFRDNVLPWGRV